MDNAKVRNSHYLCDNCLFVMVTGLIMSGVQFGLESYE